MNLKTSIIVITGNIIITIGVIIIYVDNVYEHNLFISWYESIYIPITSIVHTPNEINTIHIFKTLYSLIKFNIDSTKTAYTGSIIDSMYRYNL